MGRRVPIGKRKLAARRSPPKRLILFLRNRFRLLKPSFPRFARNWRDRRTLLFLAKEKLPRKIQTNTHPLIRRSARHLRCGVRREENLPLNEARNTRSVRAPSNFPVFLRNPAFRKGNPRAFRKPLLPPHRDDTDNPPCPASLPAFLRHRDSLLLRPRRSPRASNPFRRAFRTANRRPFLAPRAIPGLYPPLANQLRPMQALHPRNLISPIVRMDSAYWKSIRMDTAFCAQTTICPERGTCMYPLRRSVALIFARATMS